MTVTGESPVVSVSTSQVSTSYNREWVRERAGAALLVLRPDQLGAGRQRDSQRRQSSAASRSASAPTRTRTRSTAPTSARRRGRTPTRSKRSRCSQLGASAEYGNVQGAVFNIVTRQGGNAFHGDANVYFQNDDLTGRNTTDAQDDGRPYHRDDLAGHHRAGSGPFIKDKFWFFGSLQTSATGSRSRGSTRLLRRSPMPGACSASSTTTSAEPSADARLSRRLLLDSGDRHRVHRAQHDHAESRPQPDAGPRLHGRALQQDGDRGAVLGLLAAGSNDPNEERRAAHPAAVRRPGHRGHHRRHLRTGPRTGAGGTAFRGRCRSYVENFLGGSHDFKVGVQYTGARRREPDRPNNDIYLTYSVTGRPIDGDDPAALSPGRADAKAVGHLHRRHLSLRAGPRSIWACATTTATACTRRSRFSICRATRPARCRRPTTTCTTGQRCHRGSA